MVWRWVLRFRFYVKRGAGLWQKTYECFEACVSENTSRRTISAGMYRRMGFLNHVKPFIPQNAGSQRSQTSAQNHQTSCCTLCSLTTKPKAPRRAAAVSLEFLVAPPAQKLGWRLIPFAFVFKVWCFRNREIHHDRFNRWNMVLMACFDRVWW